MTTPIQNKVNLKEENPPIQKNIAIQVEDDGFPIDWFFNIDSPPISPERISKMTTRKFQLLSSIEQIEDKEDIQ